MEGGLGEPAEEQDDAEDRLDPPAPGFVAGLAMRRSAEDDPDAKALLREQTRVLHLQAEHLHEQREVQLSHLKARRISEWMKVVLQGLTGVVGLGVGLTVLALVIGAMRSHDVIVDAFDTPPAMAAQGVSGKVVASGLLDALSHLQAATRATTAKRRLASAWRGDIKVEVPETGVSIGELRQILHETLGHDLHVDGDLVQTPAGGLALTVRGDEVAARTFTGAVGDLDRLTTQAAEYVYGAMDPYLLATYLSNAGRTADTLAFLEKAYPSAAEAEQPDLLNQWGNAYFDTDRLTEAAAKYRAAIALRPDFWKAWGNLVLALETAEGEEAAWKVGMRMATAKRDRGESDANPTSRDAFDTLVQDWTQDFADLTWDVRTHGRSGTGSDSVGADLAWDEAQRHDWAAAQLHLNEADPDDPSTAITGASIEARRDMEAGAPAAAAAQLAPMAAKVAADPSLRALWPTLGCELGLAYALSGQQAQGMALIAAGGRWVTCFAAKADALAAAGDWPGAVAQYRAAIALAPDLPLGYQRYGLALLRRGLAVQAAAQFAAAHTRGPGWADPLKGQGDASAAQGRWTDAVTVYDAALSKAPHWGAVQAAKAAAAAHLG